MLSIDLQGSKAHITGKMRMQPLCCLLGCVFKLPILHHCCGSGRSEYTHHVGDRLHELAARDKLGQTFVGTVVHGLLRQESATAPAAYRLCQHGSGIIHDVPSLGAIEYHRFPARLQRHTSVAGCIDLLALRHDIPDRSWLPRAAFQQDVPILVQAD